MLLAVWGVGFAKAAAGLAALILEPSILAQRNPANIPAWIPGSLSIVLLACSLCIARRELVFGALAAFWALAAGAFARPALLWASWPDPPVEWLAAPLLAGLVAAAASRSLPVVVRVAVGCGAGAAILPYLVAFAASDQPSPGAAAIVYTTTAALAVVCAGAAQSLR